MTDEQHALADGYRRLRTLPNGVRVLRRSQPGAGEVGVLVLYRAFADGGVDHGRFAVHTGPGSGAGGFGHVAGNYALGNGRSFADWVSAAGTVCVLHFPGDGMASRCGRFRFVLTGAGRYAISVDGQAVCRRTVPDWPTLEQAHEQARFLATLTAAALNEYLAPKSQRWVRQVR